MLRAWRPAWTLALSLALSDPRMLLLARAFTRLLTVFVIFRTDLEGGFVQLFSGEASEVEGQVAAGRLRVLVTLAPERMEGPLANVPTARESGVDVTWVTWRGFYVPADIGDEAYDRWVDVIRQVGTSPEWEDARRANRLQPFFMTGAEFSDFVLRQVADFREMSREIGLIE